MNRFRKEELRKGQVDRQNSEIEELARKIHIDRFPEEYDHYNDSISDAADRRCGINPMSATYIAKVAEKRRLEGVAPLGDNGLPVSKDTWDIAYRAAEALVRDDSNC